MAKEPEIKQQPMKPTHQVKYKRTDALVVEAMDVVAKDKDDASAQVAKLFPDAKIVIVSEH